MPETMRNPRGNVAGARQGVITCGHATEATDALAEVSGHDMSLATSTRALPALIFICRFCFSNTEDMYIT
ncbi:hypothetical protein DPMN_110802 [Dreissena polymorpha]|uniref:Uncharacterized protein n=1 Tax=Dreissena polymorpha TaxID=45954 RepID=A0A9D4KCQ6_DREPO|nr:hypothetical protein DPMN_110802 [Dreissena polymorpha]